MKEKFSDKKITSARLAKLEQVIPLLDERINLGYTVTLRALHYARVGADLCPNDMKHYKELGRLLVDGRMCGLVNWSDLEDKTRDVNDAYDVLKQEEHKIELSDIRRSIEFDLGYYRLHSWLHQPYYAEVWVEKDALLSVVEHAASEHNTPYASMRGFPSATFVKDGADRFKRQERDGKDCVLLLLSDHDPSGLSMEGDLNKRFSEMGAAVAIERIGLTKAQVDEYNLPANFAKEDDRRFKSYGKLYGKDSWELDALHPSTLKDIILSELRKYYDDDIHAKNEEYVQESIKAMQDKYKPLLDYIDQYEKAAS